MDEEKRENPQGSEAADSAGNTDAAQKIFCTRCGAELSQGQEFCPKCGQKAGAKGKSPVALPSKNKILAGAGAVVVLLLLLFVVGGRGPKSVTLSKSEETVRVGETVELSFTTDPADAKNQTVTWSSSNEVIARVKEGVVSGVNEGECVITVKTKNGKTDTCTLTVTAAKPDLKKVYDANCDPAYATVASDGSYLFIDTNPADVEDFFSQNAYGEIMSVNLDLGLPETVLNKMGQTRSIDGMQSYSTEDIEVSWTYHPDHGLEVTYSVKS